MSQPSARVLVVEDEEPIANLVRGYLEAEGFAVRVSGDGIEAVDAAREDSPDVIVLDVMLPGIDGVEVCRRVRMFSDAYVLMLTARADEIDRIVGLSVGADDYLAKPFSPRELVARVKAMLRRPRVVARTRTSELLIDSARRRVTARGADVPLTTTEFDILAALARDPGVVLSRDQLLDRVWGPEYVGDGHLVDVHVANLRTKIGADLVETVRGVGYRLAEPHD